MRFSVLLPLALALALALLSSASLVLPLAATAASRITRRQADDCISECDVQSETDACGTNMACLCTSSIASGLQECVQCKYEADPASQQTLQDALDQFARGCQTSDHPIGSLTLSAIGASSSTSVRSAISSTASQASPTGGATGDGNGASSVTVQMTGAFVAVGVAAALAVL